MIEYAELHCHSHFSLLDAASSPRALVQEARRLGLTALALTDHDSLAGAIRFWQAAQEMGLPVLIGAEVTLADGYHLTLLAEDQRGYANLCRLITAARLDQLPAQGEEVDARSWPGKVAPALTWERLAQNSRGVIALSGCRAGPVAAPLQNEDEALARRQLGTLQEIFSPGRLFVEVQHHYLPQDDRLIRNLLALADSRGLPVVATNNVHYATDDDAPLRDALVAIDHNQSLTAARRAGRLFLNRTYRLASGPEMGRRFGELPEALANSVAIARRCQVSLDFSGYRLPAFPTDAGEGEFARLYQLCHQNLPHRYPRLVPQVLSQLAHELSVIEKAGLAGYFLLVWDLVRYAREQGIRCQGRGSAANSIVAYLLEITRVDPLAHHLLFERFLSPDKFTMPDIDLDLAADRREEVIRYVYQRYGSAHVAMVCNVITYRAPSALGDLGKALEIPQETLDRLAGTLDTRSPAAAADALCSTLALPPEGPGPTPLRHLLQLLRRIEGCPRHLSIHSGGMIITGPPLVEMVPLEPATMAGRVICQWDKDSVEDAGLIKIDVLSLRTLGMITEAVTHIQAMGQSPPDLDGLSLDDPAIFEMLQRADTVGTFQVESRSQQQMLPRLQPQRFEDMIVEIAIVRPGPIQGGAVHPYLRRRAGLEAVTYAHPCLEPVLAETLGVLLFQEQAIRVAVAGAGFLPGEADLLRRALSRKNSQEALAALQERFLQGAARQGIDAETGRAIFAQLAAFAGYGFCKSHAASFALIAYQTLWLKRYHPAAFYCALLNHQPMGFYSPEVLIGDAARHGVDLLPPDVQISRWPYTLEKVGHTRARSGPWTLRTGLRAVTGVGEDSAHGIEGARDSGPFQDLSDFCRRTRLPRDEITNLIRAGALDSLGNRRQLLWALGNLPAVTEADPPNLDLEVPIPQIELPPLPELEQTVWEYELLGLSPSGQIMGHYREALRRAGIHSIWEVKSLPAGRKVAVAGMMVVRQRPATAKGILFVSLEDESGLLDLVVKPQVYDRYRAVLRGSPLIVATGLTQRAGRAASVLVGTVRSLGS